MLLKFVFDIRSVFFLLDVGFSFKVRVILKNSMIFLRFSDNVGLGWEVGNKIENKIKSEG